LPGNPNDEIRDPKSGLFGFLISQFGFSAHAYQAHHSMS